MPRTILDKKPNEKLATLVNGYVYCRKKITIVLKRIHNGLSANSVCARLYIENMN